MRQLVAKCHFGSDMNVILVTKFPNSGSIKTYYRYFCAQLYNILRSIQQWSVTSASPVRTASSNGPLLAKNRHCRWQYGSIMLELTSNEKAFCRQRKLELVIHGTCLTLVATNILEPFQQVKSGNKYVAIIADWHSELTRAIQITNLTSIKRATIFSKNWVNQYGIPDINLLDKG